MRLEIASNKAVKYACMNFHYAKAIPLYRLAYSVFNDNNEFCGVIVYGGGVNPKMGAKYNLQQGQYLELVRVALNGKQGSTSKAVSLSIKLIKKNNPQVQLLISYADKGQNHYGTIYQATNWYFVEDMQSSGIDVFYNGKWGHPRGPSELLSKEQYKALPKRIKAGKRKYLYPLNDKWKKYCENIKLPYPKKELERGDGVEPQF